MLAALTPNGREQCFTLLYKYIGNSLQFIAIIAIFIAPLESSNKISIIAKRRAMFCNYIGPRPAHTHFAVSLFIVLLS
jgi:hypothetical protein